MIAFPVSKYELTHALNEASAKYGGNLIWNRRPEPLNMDQTRWRFTLRVTDSKGPGHRLGFLHSYTGSRRRLSSACWHAHGTFFDCLPPGITIITGNQRYETGTRWVDRDVGSIVYPENYSDLCDCYKP